MLKYEAIDNQKPEWVVFIHGIGGSTKTWKKQIEYFSEQYNLLLLDLPGHGENADNVIFKVDTKRLNKGIVDTLDHLQIKKAHFVGLSLGTIVIANFAMQHPTRVDKIILGGPVLKITGVYRSMLLFANWIKKYIPYKMLYKFFAWFMMPRTNHKKSRRIFTRECVKLNKKTMYAWIEYLLQAMHPERLITTLDAMKKKILVIAGDEDHCFIKGAKDFVKSIKTSTMNIIEHCGHVCSIEKAVRFNQLALSYLRAI